VTEVQVNAPLDGPLPTNFEAEPSVAQNPTNPLNIVVGHGSEQAEPPCTDTFPSSCPFVFGISISAFAASFDGGQTFPCRGLIDLSAFGKWAEADSWVTFDSRGNAYYGTLAFDTVSGPPANNADVFVAKSTDGGCTWSQAAKASRTSPAVYDDKPSVEADANLSSPFRDNLYAAWTKFTNGADQMMFNRSVDGGATWEQPQTLSQSAATQGGRIGAVIGIAPSGAVHVVWLDYVKGQAVLREAISYDGGKTFRRKNITVVGLDTENPFDAPLPGTTFISGATLPDVSVGQDGTLYAVYGRRSAGHTVVMLTTSADGLTWSAPIDAADVAGRSEVFQTVAVDPNGVVNVALVAVDDVPEGTPPGAGVVSAQAYYTQSVDGGQTFAPPAPLGSVSFDPDGEMINCVCFQFLGDYITATADAGHLYAVWTDTRNGTPCAAADAYVLGEGPKPNVIQQCPTTFGNNDIFLGTVAY
jgi:hypothetical protein